MVENVNRISTINIRPPQEYAKYEYEVVIDGKKQMACVEKTPNGRVTIKVGDGKDVKVINTDVNGLMEFNKNYKPRAILYSSKPEEKPNEQEKVYSDQLAKIMRNIALASMMINGKHSNQALGDFAIQQTMQDNFNAMQMHQQAVDTALQAHNMGVQMTTPGMGIV